MSEGIPDTVAARPTGPAAWPLFSSGFRPFFLLAAAFAPWPALAWPSGLMPPGWGLAVWHGHEMIFGYAAAMISGFLLTALPSWAGTVPVSGGRLALLAATWLGGRLAMAAGGPGPVVALVDLLEMPLLIGLLLPGLLAVKHRRFMVLVPVLTVLALGNLAFHRAMLAGDDEAAARGLFMAVRGIMLLYALVAGFLVPVFTANALREAGRPVPKMTRRWLDGLALLALALWVALDLAVPSLAAPRPAVGLVALAAAGLHGARLALWRGWRAADAPLAWVLHLAYAWFVTALVLAGLAALGAPVPASAWVHAVTTGAIGTKTLGFLWRISLRHTGRPLVPGRLAVPAFALVTLAAIGRLLTAFMPDQPLLMLLSALAWTLPFLLFLWGFARILVSPSLPYGAADGGAGSDRGIPSASL